MNDERIDFEKLSKAMLLFIKFVKYVNEELCQTDVERLLDDIAAAFEKGQTVADGENEEDKKCLFLQ